jgi:hypothetical protein
MTTTAILCGHRWTQTPCPTNAYGGGHWCGRSAGHEHNPGLPRHYRHRCRCGAER